MRRLKLGNAADFEFGAVGKSLEEPAADAAFDKNVLGSFAAEENPSFNGHHLPISSVKTRNTTSGERSTRIAFRIVIGFPPRSV